METKKASRKTGVSVVVSPDLDGYATGTTPAHSMRCALCRHAPCDCPPFGSEEYLALVNRRHG